MSAIVLDASAALRVVIDAEASAHLREAINGAVAVYAPDFYVVECANALWKYVAAKRKSEDEALSLHDEATRMVDISISASELFPEVLREASRLSHPVYDLVYVIAARRLGASLVTADKRLATIARKLHVAVVE